MMAEVQLAPEPQVDAINTDGVQLNAPADEGMLHILGLACSVS